MITTQQISSGGGGIKNAKQAATHKSSVVRAGRLKSKGKKR